MDFYCNTLINIPSEFHVTIINIDPVKIDHVTRKLMKRADVYLQPSINQELIPLIMKQQFDLIIYPEVGMSPNIYYLAMQRLAKNQAVIIGHPDTTGIKTIDYYISWSYFHKTIKNPERQFTERLVQLKNFPLCYDWPKELKRAKKSRKELGIGGKGDRVYFIPMLLFKVHPMFDDVIDGILKKDKHAVVLLVCYNKIEHQLMRRFQRIPNKNMKRVNLNYVFKGRLFFSIKTR